MVGVFLQKELNILKQNEYWNGEDSTLTQLINTQWGMSSIKSPDNYDGILTNGFLSSVFKSDYLVRLNFSVRSTYDDLSLPNNQNLYVSTSIDTVEMKMMVLKPSNGISYATEKMIGVNPIDNQFVFEFNILKSDFKPIFICMSSTTSFSAKFWLNNPLV